MTDSEYEAFQSRKRAQMEMHQRRHAERTPSGGTVNPSQQQKPYERCVGKAGQPGSLIKIILSELGIKADENCACEWFCNRMNAWGWTGCATIHLHEVVKWFMDRAKERPGITAASITKSIIERIKLFSKEV